MTDQRFPILIGYPRGRESIQDCPTSVPWSFVEPHRKQANLNHSQTLERLAERGGLAPSELYYVAHDLKWPYGKAVITERAAVDWLIGLNLEAGDE